MTSRNVYNRNAFWVLLMYFRDTFGMLWMLDLILETTRGELEETKMILETTKGDLEDTKVVLETAKGELAETQNKLDACLRQTRPKPPTTVHEHTRYSRYRRGAR